MRMRKGPVACVGPLVVVSKTKMDRMPRASRPYGRHAGVCSTGRQNHSVGCPRMAQFLPQFARPRSLARRPSTSHPVEKTTSVSP